MASSNPARSLSTIRVSSESISVSEKFPATSLSAILSLEHTKPWQVRKASYSKVRDELTVYPSLARGLYRIEELADATLR